MRAKLIFLCLIFSIPLVISINSIFNKEENNNNLVFYCAEIAPEVFVMRDDGLAYVQEDGRVFDDPGGAEGLANFGDEHLEAVIESAEECPGECIFIEAD